MIEKINIPYPPHLHKEFNEYIVMGQFLELNNALYYKTELQVRGCNTTLVEIPESWGK